MKIYLELTRPENFVQWLESVPLTVKSFGWCGLPTCRRGIFVFCLSPHCCLYIESMGPFKMTLGVYSTCDCRLWTCKNDGVWMSVGIIWGMDFIPKSHCSLLWKVVGNPVPLTPTWVTHVHESETGHRTQQ